MTWSMGAWAKLICVVVFAAAAFFVAPIADAATCQPEPSAAHAVVEHDPGEGDHTGGNDHGVCPHGHCHHAAVARGMVSDEAPLQVFARPIHAFSPNDVLHAFAPEGLKRPPRA